MYPSVACAYSQGLQVCRKTLRTAAVALTLPYMAQHDHFPAGFDYAQLAFRLSVQLYCEAMYHLT